MLSESPAFIGGIGGVSSLGGLLLTIAAIWIWSQDTSENYTKPFLLLIISFAIWSSFGGLTVLFQQLGMKIFAQTVVSITALFVPAFWIHFAVLYTNAWTRSREYLVYITYTISFIFAIIIATNSWHQMYWTDLRIVIDFGYPIITSTRLPLYWISYVFSYSIALASVILVGYRSLETNSLHRQKFVIYVLGPFIPISLELSSTLGLVPYRIDISPVGFAIWGFMMVYVFYSYTVYNVSPIGRKFAFESIQNPILIFDRNGQLTDWNPMSKTFLQENPGGEVWGDVLENEVGGLLNEQLGGSFEDVITQIDTERHDKDGVTKPLEFDEVKIPVDGSEENRVYNIHITPIIPNGGSLRGYVIVFYDVTTLTEHRREVEKRNERLDRFASVVSHDLRNPINVANGYLNMINNNTDMVESVQDALDRMEDIINELLVLAREDEAISKTDTVDIEQVANDAWDIVNTFDGEIHVDIDMEIPGDASYIMSIFENLYRNVYDHGDMDSDVFVGEIEGEQEGFYIADTGPGVPKEAQGSLFKEGFTTDEDGTGLGLSIVNKIVEGHGWSIELDTDTDQYGAKFDIYTTETED